MEEQNQYSNPNNPIKEVDITDDKKIIDKNEKWFSFFVYLPQIVISILGLLVFIGGFSVLENAGIAGLVAFWFVGGIVCVIVYCGLKLTLCYQILNIYYLKEIEKNTRKKG